MQHRGCRYDQRKWQKKKSTKLIKQHLPGKVWKTHGKCKRQRNHLYLTTSGWHGSAKRLPRCHRQQAGMLPGWQRGRAKGAERPGSLGNSLRHLHLGWNTHTGPVSYYLTRITHLIQYWRANINKHSQPHWLQVNNLTLFLSLPLSLQSFLLQSTANSNLLQCSSTKNNIWSY